MEKEEARKNVEDEETGEDFGDEGPRKYGGSRNWFLRIGIGVLACIAIGLGGYFYFFHLRASKEPPPVQKHVQKPAVKAALPLPPPPPQKVVREEEEKIAPVILPNLGQSDGAVREMVKALSSDPKLANWLKNTNIIRRITAAVDNVADGRSPRASLKFLAPKKGFSVQKKGEKFYINPKSYTRYNLAADVFQSLNAEGIVRIFREFKPLFQDAYRELGYKDRDFQNTLVRAIQELLRVPVVEGDVLLGEKEEVVFILAATMADEKLEDLSDAQKHLLRMGPKNTAKIQGKLREIAQALGVPENQIPKSRVYRSKVK